MTLTARRNGVIGKYVQSVLHKRSFPFPRAIFARALFHLEESPPSPSSAPFILPVAPKSYTIGAILVKVTPQGNRPTENNGI